MSLECHTAQDSIYSHLDWENVVLGVTVELNSYLFYLSIDLVKAHFQCLALVCSCCVQATVTDIFVDVGQVDARARIKTHHIDVSHLFVLLINFLEQLHIELSLRP